MEQWIGYGLKNIVLKNLTYLTWKNSDFYGEINTMLISGMSQLEADIHSDHKNRVFKIVKYQIFQTKKNFGSPFCSFKRVFTLFRIFYRLHLLGLVLYIRFHLIFRLMKHNKYVHQDDPLLFFLFLLEQQLCTLILLI